METELIKTTRLLFHCSYKLDNKRPIASQS